MLQRILAALRSLAAPKARTEASVPAELGEIREQLGKLYALAADVASCETLSNLPGKAHFKPPISSSELAERLRTIEASVRTLGVDVETVKRASTGQSSTPLSSLMTTPTVTMPYCDEVQMRPRLRILDSLPELIAAYRHRTQ